MLTRFIVACGVVVLASAGLAGGAAAQAWPQKQPIRLVLPFPPGSSLDSLARPVFDHVGKQLGQNFVFEHRPGAGGTLGMAAVAKADPDGYTLLVNSSVHTVTPSTFAKLPYDTVRDFSAIAALGQFPNVLVAPPGRFRGVQDLVSQGQAKPGAITYGSGGVGAATHVNAERFRLSAKFDAVHVPFKGAPEAVREVLGGRIDFYFSPMPTVVELIRTKKLDGLALSSLKRSATLPNIPTTLEAGYPDSDYIFWIGVFAPSGVPKDIVTRLHDQITKALNDPTVRERIQATGAEPLVLTPAQFDAQVRAEIEANATVVKAAGIVPH